MTNGLERTTGAPVPSALNLWRGDAKLHGGAKWHSAGTIDQCGIFSDDAAGISLEPPKPTNDRGANAGRD